MSESPPTNIHEALSLAKTRIGTIGKEDKNKDLGYAFRGIDAIVNRVGPIFAELGIIVAPIHRLISSDEVVAKSGAKGYRVVIESTWTFSIHHDRIVDNAPARNEAARPGIRFPETSSITAQTLGESIDYSDKALNQAQTQSFKNALAQVLTIPTGESDPDEATPEQVVPQTPGEQILEALLGEKMSKTKARKYTKEAMAELGLQNPILPESIDAIVGEAIRLRDDAESPMEEEGYE